jgi:sialic acid synthase SpsE
LPSFKGNCNCFLPHGMAGAAWNEETRSIMLRIGNHGIGDGQPVFIVAEMAWGHNGSVENGKKIIDAAADNGAAMINIHITDVGNYMVPQYGAGPGRISGDRDVESVFEFHQNLNLDFDGFQALYDHARSRDLLISAMCNDFPSLDFATENLDPDIMMIHPSCVAEERYLRAMAEKGKPLLLYVGGLRLSEIEDALQAAWAENNTEIVLQYGFQAYPTEIPDNHIHYIQTLKSTFGLPISFTDHTDADDSMALVIPLLGVALGAHMIEKHITFDRAAKPEDYEAALNPDEFKILVERIRLAEAAMGPKHWQPLSEAQQRYRNVVRKRAVAACDIPSGTTLGWENIAFKRSDFGLYPEELEHLIGKAAANDIKENDPIGWDIVE